MNYETLLTELAAGVLTVTLNRPDRLNAFTNQMMEELLALFDAIDADDAVRAVIVTGAGRGFCAGADLSSGGDTFASQDGGPDAGGPSKEGAASAARSRRVPRDGGGRVSLRIFDCTKPIIAAINGPAVGVGITQTLPMDVRLASEQAKFGFVFARRGIVPEATSSWFLPRVVGISRAMEWVASGRVFGPQEALEAGLVSQVLAQDELLPRARELAHEIADNTSAVSVAFARQMMWKMLGARHPMEAHRVESRAIDFFGSGPDAREGVESFLEKRSPNFRSKVSTDMPDFYPWWREPSFEVEEEE